MSGLLFCCHDKMLTKFNLEKQRFIGLAGKVNQIFSGSQDGPSLFFCCCDKMLTKFNLGMKEFGLQVKLIRSSVEAKTGA